MTETIAVIAPFLTGVLILLIIFTVKYLRDRSKNEVIMKALEKGVELSPDIFKPAPSEMRAKSKMNDPLSNSIITIGAGIGISVALYLFFDSIKFAAFGLIPLFVGLGQLAGFLLNKKHKRDNEDQNIVN